MKKKLRKNQVNQIKLVNQWFLYEFVIFIFRKNFLKTDPETEKQIIVKDALHEVPATVWIRYVQRITLTSTFYKGTFNKYLFLNYSMTFANVCFTFSKYSFTCPIRQRFQILLFFFLKILYFILINIIFTIGSWCWTSCLRLLFQKA